MPAQEVAIAAYADEAHVDDNRELYVANSISPIRSSATAMAQPTDGGFFLWLDVSRARRR